MRRVGFYRLLVTIASTSVVAATLTAAVGVGSAAPRGGSRNVHLQRSCRERTADRRHTGQQDHSRVHGIARQDAHRDRAGQPACEYPSFG